MTSERRKEIVDKYNHSEKRKVVLSRYCSTPKWKANYTRYKEKLRLEVKDAYGGKCQCCGESTSAFLTIHHVNGRPFKGEHGVNVLWSKVRQRGFPTDYELRCFNCNSGAKNGVCPHQIAKESVSWKEVFKL